MDAALLLAAIRGAVPATDPRSLATLDAITADLSSEGYLYRYRHDQRPLQEAEGAFVLCGFLMALPPTSWAGPARPSAGSSATGAPAARPRKFTEEYDTHQHSCAEPAESFVHAVMFESAARLARPWDAR